MNKKIVKQIFPEIVERIEQCKCATCGKDIEKESFRNKISIKEYTISGMCQDCQDSIFGKD